MQAVAKVVAALVDSGARTATKYISPTERVRATRRHRPRRGARNVDIVLTIGRPNYADRAFIKKCAAAGEPFPVRRVQLKHWPAKRGKR